MNVWISLHEEIIIDIIWEEGICREMINSDIIY